MGFVDGLAGMFGGSKVAPLSPAEMSRFDHLKQLVRDGARAWIAAGKALREIRDRQLFRASHPTFELWAEAEYGLTGRRLSQLIDGAEQWQRIAAESPQAVTPTPPAERALRELRALPEGERVAAYQEAMTTETATAGRPTPPSTRTVADTVARRRAASGRKPKVKHKPLRIKVPGAVVTVAWNGKGDGDVEAALRAAIATLAAKSRAAA